MDPLRSILDGPRATDAFVLRVVMTSPWALRIEDRAPLALVALVAGQVMVTYDDGETVQARSGDVMLLRGPEPYLVGDAADRSITGIIDTQGRCHTLTGTPLDAHMSLGVRTWGNASDAESGDAVMLLATYYVAGEVGNAVLHSLPRAAVVRQADDSLQNVFGAELGRDGPGQGVVLDRLSDLLLITALRTWFDHPDHRTPRWYAAQSDPMVGRALRLMHENVERAWTVASLAREVGSSRAAFGRRFADVVGQPPMTYLTAHRLALAADLLTGTDRTLESIAGQVGYATPFALSAAFTRERGHSPREHRRRHRSASG